MKDEDTDKVLLIENNKNAEVCAKLVALRDIRNLQTNKDNPFHCSKNLGFNLLQSYELITLTVKNNGSYFIHLIAWNLIFYKINHLILQNDAIRE